MHTCRPRSQALLLLAVSCAHCGVGDVVGAWLLCCDQAAPGWEPKPFLRGHEDRIFLLDFFGAPTPMKNGIKVGPPLKRQSIVSKRWSSGLDNDLPYHESAQQ